MRLVWVLIATSALPLFGQYPGQYPPGQYPPGGRYPGGRNPGGSPYPGNDPTQRRPRSSGPATQGKRGSKEQPVITTTFGALRRYSGKQLVIEADDHRIVWYHTTGDTAFQNKDAAAADPAKWQSGDQISVDSTADNEERFTAVTVKFEKSGAPADRAAAAHAWDLPRPERAGGSAAPTRASSRGDDERPRMRRSDTPASSEPQADPAAPPEAATTAQAPAVDPEENAAARPATTVRPPDAAPDDDDPGRPVLRRGIPAPRRGRRPANVSSGDSGGEPVILTKDAPAPAAAAAPETQPSGAPEEVDELIRKAREAAGSFSQTLPNFYCNQTTTRYQTDSPKRGWDPVDMVSAEVTYEDGHESYKNIRVGGKPVKGGMEEIGGSTSTGEFGTILRDLFEPSTAANFRRSGSEAIAGRQAVTFRFEVPRERSHWRIEAPSQLYYPAYKGSLWVDRETGRALRIEMQAKAMPQLFSFDAVESAVDYDSVKLGTAQTFLLPVNAETLSCQRSSSYCSKNRIEFRNYRKFGAESNVTFEDKK